MLRKATAGQHLGFTLVKASDGTAMTGATVTVYRVIDGGSQASATGTVTEKGFGQYDFAPTAADLNGNQVSFAFCATGAVPVEKTIVTTAADPTDAMLGFRTVTLAAPRVLDAVADGSLTVNDALYAALAWGAGKQSVVGTAFTIKTPSTGTVVRNFTLDTATNPSSRS